MKAVAKGCWLLRRLARRVQATSLGHTQKSGDLLRTRAEPMVFQIWRSFMSSIYVLHFPRMVAFKGKDAKQGTRPSEKEGTDPPALRHRQEHSGPSDNQ